MDLSDQEFDHSRSGPLGYVFCRGVGWFELACDLRLHVEKFAIRFFENRSDGTELLETNKINCQNPEVKKTCFTLSTQPKIVISGNLKH